MSSNGMECVRCPAGQSYNAESNVCEKCQPGWFKETAGQHECTACPVDTYNSKRGATSGNDCTDCKDLADTRGQSGANASQLCMCREDTFSGANGACMQCSEQRTREPSTMNCTVCAAGRHKEQVGQAPCDVCPAGFYCPGGGKAKIKCQSGELCLKGSHERQDCPAGSFCADPESEVKCSEAMNEYCPPRSTAAKQCRPNVFCPGAAEEVDMLPPLDGISLEVVNASAVRVSWYTKGGRSSIRYS